MLFRWNIEKNEWLIKHRNVCFEQAEILMENEDVVDVIEHPNQREYPNQKIAIITINSYVYLVPYVHVNDDIFLKTMIPSRKATKKYLGSENEKNQS